LNDQWSRILDLFYFFNEGLLVLARKSVCFDSAIQNLLAFLEVVQRVVCWVTLLVELRDLLDEVLDLCVTLLALLHDGSLLGLVDLLLVKVFFKFSPASAFALRLALHLLLFGPVLETEVV